MHFLIFTPGRTLTWLHALGALSGTNIHYCRTDFVDQISEIRQHSGLWRLHAFWRHIVLHHSATPGGNVAAFEAWHRSGSRRFALGMAYHFVIGNGRGMRDGELVAGSRWRRQQQGAHIAARLRDEQTGANLAAESIGVCLVGNFEHAAPTRAQLATLRRLVRVL